jgi:uncharacterized protein (DUF427 family)
VKIKIGTVEAGAKRVRVLKGGRIVADSTDVHVNGKTHDALVRWNPSPLPESAPVGGLVCFYNEKVDLFLDGDPLRRPSTKFSRATPTRRHVGEGSRDPGRRWLG